MVAVLEVRIRDHARSSGAFGDVLARHFQMHAAGMRPFGAMNGKERLDLGEDAIARPQHHLALALHGADHPRQLVGDLVRAEAHDQREPARLVLRIEDVDQSQHLVDLARRTAFQAERVADAAAELDMGVIGLPRAVADPQHVRRGAAEGARARGILPRHRLLVAQQERLMAGVEIGALELGMALEIEPAGLHEVERLRYAVGELLVMVRLRRVLDKAERPLADIGQIGVAAVHEGAQQIERGSRMPVGLDLPDRVGPARFFVELGAVDDVATVARQLYPVPLLGWGRARLGELAGDAPNLHHRQCGAIGKHNRHLQEDAQEVADIVGADVIGAGLGEALGTVAALEQETLAQRDAAERRFEVARLAGKHQRREGRNLPLHGVKRRPVRVLRHLQDRLPAPTLARPTLGHHRPPTLRHAPLRGGETLRTSGLYTRRLEACQQDMRMARLRLGPQTFAPGCQLLQADQMTKGLLSRNEVVRRIRNHAHAIRAQGATALYLLGSVARDQAQAMSDIDIFVDYDPNGSFSLLNLSGIRLIIMDEIGRNVDITTSSSLHPRLRDRILSEAVRILWPLLATWSLCLMR